ncbi:MAG: Ig-like domain-containing protein [Lachnospiraceae bacterium]|nr:Ig-like domain-containing protein [Lachnospiraceae bacterium]
MKKNKLYRVGAALMAALMVVTCMPQTSLYALAEEVSDDLASEEMETPESDAEPYAEGDTPVKDPVHVAAITLNHEKLSIQRKGSADLIYTLTPNNADVDEDKVVTFSSANPEVATVAPKAGGASVVGVGVGKTTITATTGNGKQASCEVEVTAIPVKAVIIDPSTLTIKLDDTATSGGDKTATLSVRVDPADADNTEISLSTNYDDKVITAEYTKGSEPGTGTITITALKEGTTSVVAISQSDRSITGSCEITVEREKVPLTSLSVRNTYPKNLVEGNSINLKDYVVYNPANTTDNELTWTVNESDFAVVDQFGRVTAKWKDGDMSDEKAVEVYAASKTDSSKKATFTLKIIRKKVPLKALRVDPETLVLEDAGSMNSQMISVQLDPLASTEREVTAIVSARDGKRAVLINAGKKYEEEAAKENDEEGGGTVTAVADAYGKAYFTVTAKELEGLKKQDSCTITFIKKGANPESTSAIKVKCDVTVNKYVKPVDKLLLPDSLIMTDGSEENLTAVIEPLAAEDRHIVWTVDDPEIAEIIDGVDSDGRNEATLVNGELSATVKIKANMVGKCIITATAAGDVKKTCTVTVEKSENPATGLTIKSDAIPNVETTEIYLKPGQTYVLKPEVTPADAFNKKVKWTSGSPVVASVIKGTNETGVVTANALGICTITAQASGDTSACTKEVRVHVVSPAIEVRYKGAPEKWTYVPEDQPITKEMLRKELEVFFWPRVNPVPDNDKLTLGNGEADSDDYALRILKEDGKTEKEYEEEDMQKPGVRTLVISYPYEGVTYKGTVQVEMKEFDEAELISVTPLSWDEADVWNVPNGTPASALPIAETAEILVGREVLVEGKKELKTSKLNAKIAWRVGESDYDPSNTEVQEFTVFGDVLLPDYVTNPKGISLIVQVRVHVREQASSGKRAERPVFSVLGGETIANMTAVEVPYGSKIMIAAPTEGADIYYMVDRRPDAERGIPHDVEHQYKSPIEITAKTTTIYAVAACYGYDDSECSECTIKLIAVEDIDPDDPDAPLPDDVTDDDKEQIGGKVPNGLWAVVQAGADEKDGFAYTGKAIKPAVHVYDRTMLLTEKKDYTVTYSNNINAGSAKGSPKPPTITVKGKGNYEGKALVYFTIKPQDIADSSVFMDEYTAVAYDNKEHKPKPSLTWNGKKLTRNKDYTYADVSYTEPGLYKVTVQGIGNYKGTRTMDYEIYKGGVAVSNLTISAVPNYKYTGREIRPDVTVKYKKTVLQEGTEKGKSGNYWIKYENCTKVGNASIVIMGKGNYKGSKRINFKILPTAKISQAGISLDVAAAGVSYTGKPHTPKCTVNYLGRELAEDKDYKLSYQNNIKAGTATVVIEGMGEFTGTAKKTFKILRNDISGLTALMGTSFVYEKGGCKPKPKITYNGMELQEGTDYTLSYKNNNVIGNTASVTMKGKGNYQGKIVQYFEVTMQDLANLKVVASDKVYQEKKNIYATSVKVVDLNGKSLKAGTDYSKDIYYTYESGDKAGQPVLSTDIIPVGTLIGVEVRATKNSRCYTGTVHGTYRIVQADVSKAKVSINPQEYTGRSIKLKKSQIQITLKGVQLRNDDYEIVGYENNVNQGNAKIIIRGVGSYGGTKTATFKIKKKGVLNLKF